MSTPICWCRWARCFDSSPTRPSQPEWYAGAVNQFSHARTFPSSDVKTDLRPDVDTLYSSANHDLGPEPLMLSAPETNRFQDPSCGHRDPEFPHHGHRYPRAPSDVQWAPFGSVTPPVPLGAT